MCSCSNSINYSVPEFQDYCIWFAGIFVLKFSYIYYTIIKNYVFTFDDIKKKKNYLIRDKRLVSICEFALIIRYTSVCNPNGNVEHRQNIVEYRSHIIRKSSDNWTAGTPYSNRNLIEIVFNYEGAGREARLKANCYLLLYIFLFSTKKNPLKTIPARSRHAVKTI